ncbi:MAG: UDP-N-acetylmuramate--L-alanine ligase [Chloroflexota bacterium]|nr:UDP-N-acetylmuramate--L-alanine ligase [Chloroflexota bacterium]
MGTSMSGDDETHGGTTVARGPERGAGFTLPDPPAKVHFVGIGGAGMSGLARILHASGYAVSGSDSHPSDQVAALAGLGMVIQTGHAGVAMATAADLVVMTAAVRSDNPEIVAAVSARVPVVKRAVLLGALASRFTTVAVAGSHGKSTTSGMLVAALRSLGADPTFAIGATVNGLGTNAAPGGGGEMVVEADEYDYSFLSLEPDLAIVTNIDFDHPDIFPNQTAYDEAFVRFMGNIQTGGTLVLSGDDPGCLRLRDALTRSDLTVVTFGTGDDLDWSLSRDGADWRVRGPDGQDVGLVPTVPGHHNALNAAAALAALSVLGHDATAAADALGQFTGVGRRFDVLGEARGVTVVDDYAHHPSEIRATVGATRDRWPGKRVVAVFQPHTFSRTRALLDPFAAALATADLAVVMAIYAARETDDLGVSAASLADLVPGALVAGGPEDTADMLWREVRSGDVVLTLGAGTVTALGPLLLRALRDGGTADASLAGVGAGGPVAATTAGPGPARPDRRRPAGPSSIIVPGDPPLTILRDSAMSLHTTWRVGGPADYLVRAANPDAFERALAWAAAEGLPVTVIGGGSNLLVDDAGLRGLTILARTPGERAEGLVKAEDREDHVLLRVAAQAPLSWAGRHAAGRGWAGLDWAVGLPGTVGGATVNNAGAHGSELKDTLTDVVVIHNTGRNERRPASSLAATYRMTTLKAQGRPRDEHVLWAEFRLPRADRETLVALADDHARFRKATQPTGACAGSTFANPPGDYAGRLLEEAGMKGSAVGPARFSPKHANWVINEGGATADQIRELIATARERVRDRFGVELRQEVEEIGDPPGVAGHGRDDDSREGKGERGVGT